MYARIIDNEFHNLSAEPFPGSVEVEVIEGKSNDTHIMVGFKYKFANSKHMLVPHMVERSPADKAKQARKAKESDATVEFQGFTVKANDKSISMLQAYIQSSVGVVWWKCVNGWLMLGKQDMSDLLELILNKKVQLFEEERLS